MRHFINSAAIVMLLLACSPAGAVVFQITPPNGGDCVSLGGFWLIASQRCVLVSHNLASNDTIRVESVTLRMQGLSTNLGVIDNMGTVEVFGEFQNFGQILNHDEMEVYLRLVNNPGATLRNFTGSQLRIFPPASIENAGTIDNSTLILIPEEGTLHNTGMLFNTGFIIGGVSFDSVLLNDGSIENTGGVLRDLFVENRAMIQGGDIEDMGAVLGKLNNRVGGTVTDVATGDVEIDNSGTLENHTFALGIVQNRRTGVIRDAGGLIFLMNNNGFVENVSGLETINSFNNQETGVFINRASLTNHAMFTNRGVVENRGPWLNAGAVVNHGTFLNMFLVTNCTDRSDVEEFNNFGIVSNSGKISTCGTVNSGTWYECGSMCCPAGDPVIQTVDTDNDRVCDGADCSQNDGATWHAPGEVPEISIEETSPGGLLDLEWVEPAYLGGQSVLYDVIGSLQPDDFEIPVGTCLASDVAGTSLTDDIAVAPGETLNILVRATGCIIANGSGGQSSDGTQRQLTDCPQ